MMNIKLRDISKIKYPMVKDIELVNKYLYEEFNISLYKEQIQAAKAIYNGTFVQVKTGEGKSIINLLSAYLLRERHENIYIVSINDYLAERDYLKFKNIYEKLGLSCSFNKPLDRSSEIEKKEVYTNNVIYTSTNELVFDYLRSEVGSSCVRVNLDGAIIDEVDYVLLDNANSEFSIATGAVKNEGPTDLYKLTSGIAKSLQVGIVNSRYIGKIDESKFDAIVDKVSNRVHLTTCGRNKLENILKIDDILTEGIIYRAIIDTISANIIYEKNKDYIIQDNRIILINKDNGRKMVNSRWDNGLHLAIEIKEEVNIDLWHSSNISISYQVFYNLFKQIYGLSGTLIGTDDELLSIYNKNIKFIAPHSKSQRLDYADVITQQKSQKFEILGDILKDMESNKPLLIIASNDIECNVVFDYITKIGLKKTIQVINSFNYLDCEKEYIKHAGSENQITISTFLLSRGIDIVINDDVEKLGGLEVISLNRYYNNRIDEQIRGRAGRQGKKGSSRFIYSLEDDVFLNMFINEKEFYNNLSKKQFKSTVVQRSLRKASLKSQQINSADMCKFRGRLYFIQNFIHLQVNSLMDELINNDINSLKEYIYEYINEEFKGVVLPNEAILFLNNMIYSKHDVETIAVEICEDIYSKLSIVSEDNMKLFLKKLVYKLIYENIESYKDEAKLLSGLLQLESVININKYLKELELIFNKYKKSIIYEFMDYLQRLNVEVDSNNNN